MVERISVIGREIITSEAYCELAKKINIQCGANLPDSVELDDLYFWNRKEQPRLSSPYEWLKTISKLTADEKKYVTTTLGIVNRFLCKKMDGLSPTLGDLRKFTSEEMSGWKSTGNSTLGAGRANFIMITFRIAPK